MSRKRRKTGSPPEIKQDGKYAVVYLNGDKVRLGRRYESEEAQNEYRRIIAEWVALGVSMDPQKKSSCYGNIQTAIQMMVDIHHETFVKGFRDARIEEWIIFGIFHAKLLIFIEVE